MTVPSSRPPAREGVQDEVGRREPQGRSGVAYGGRSRLQGRVGQASIGGDCGSEVGSFPLGATSGRFTVGAWAARLEVVRLLDSRCDPNRFINFIRRGNEGTEALVARSPLRRIARSPGYDPSLGESPGGEQLLGSEGSNDDAEPGIQRALLESLSRENREERAWVTGDAGLFSSQQDHLKDLYSSDPDEYKFAKKAAPPAPGSEKRELGGPAAGVGRAYRAWRSPQPDEAWTSVGEAEKKAGPPNAGQDTAANVETLLGTAGTPANRRSDMVHEGP